MTKSDVLLNKIRALPPEKIEEVLDFVDFLAARVQGREAAAAWAAASAPAFKSVWDNPEDGVYDAL